MAMLRALAGDPVWRAAGIGACVWAVLILTYGAAYFLSGVQPVAWRALDALLFLMALVLPVGLIVAVALGVRAALALHDAVGALAARAAAIEDRLALLDAAGGAPRPAAPPRASAEAPADVVEPILKLADGQRRIEAGLREVLVLLNRTAVRPAAPAARTAPAPAQAAAPGPRRVSATDGPPPAAPDPQAALPLEDRPDGAEAPLGWADLVRALDFPRDAEDTEGFDALRRALAVHPLAEALQAAEDVLTLFLDDQIYVEDLDYSPGPAAAWRAFLAGERGGLAVEAGRIADEAMVARIAERLKSDQVFRDACLHFQRRFDRLLAAHVPDAEDAAVAALADTRSARAFMLLVRAGGAFQRG